ncbi:MAG: hypothetical protein C4321_07985, partial [Chloroflexota bacterium]
MGRLRFSLTPTWDIAASLYDGSTNYQAPVTPAAPNSPFDTRRSRVGFDTEIFNILGGTFRAEYVEGRQGPTSNTPTPGVAPGPSAKVLGYNVEYVRNFGLKHQLAVRYDLFDPNKDVSNNEIGTTSLAWN